MRRGLLPVLLLIISLAGAGFSGLAPATAQSSGRTVTAVATCTAVTQVDEGSIEVNVANDAGMPIIISSVEGFTTGQAFNPEWTMADPGIPVRMRIADGNDLTFSFDWNDVLMEGEFGGALIITNAGLLMPMCDGEEVGLNRPLGPAPDDDDDAHEELATIAAETIGALEMWRAYPALYTLLHPDAQELIPFETIACWYADQFGLPGEWKDTVFSTTVLDVDFDDWTWSVNGKEYDDTAEITYEQEIGTMARTDTVESTMHLAFENGLYRWFFGSSLDSIEALPTDCDLGN